jgi:hypothetical protein
MAKDWTIPALKEHTDTRFEAVYEAIKTADAAFEKRMDNANEFRATLETQQRTFVTKEQVRWAFTALLGGVTLAVAIFVAFIK